MSRITTFIRFLIAVTILLTTSSTSSAQYQPANIPVSAAQLQQEETSIAVSPSNVNILFAGFNYWLGAGTFDGRAGFSFSTNGGINWFTNSDGYLLVPTYYHELDPSVSFNRNGVAFYCFFAQADDQDENPYRVIYVAKTSNYGLNWSWQNASSTSAILRDKPYMFVDNTGGTYDGRIYVAWFEAEPSGSAIRFSYSSDGGGSFPTSTYETLESTQGDPNGGSVFFGVPTVGPTGELYVAWFRSISSTGQKYMKVAKSTNGGDTFPQVSVIPIVEQANCSSGCPGPSPAVSPVNGYIFVSIVDGGPIRLLRSINGGVGWSDLSITGFPGNGVVSHPWTTVSPSGVLQLVYRYHSSDITSPFHLYLVESYDNGITFGSHLRVTSIESAGHKSPGGGPDYLGIASTVGTVYPLWTDSRNYDTTSLDVYTAITNRPPSSASAAAISSNGQRKVVRQSDGMLNLVFETGGEIWAARRATSDLEWKDYHRLSSGIGGSNAYPCITERSGYLYVVWQKARVTENNWDILYNYSTDGGSTWLSSPIGGVVNIISPNPGPIPVIMTRTPNPTSDIIITYRVSTELKSIRATTATPGQTDWGTPITVGGSNTNSRNPSMSYKSSGSFPFKLAWDENEKIWFSEYHPGNPDYWDGLKQVNSGTYGVIKGDQNSSVAVSANNDFHIAWQAEYNSKGIIMYNKNLSSVYSQFGPPTGTTAFYRPSITGHLQGRASIAWHDNLNRVWANNYDGTLWTRGDFLATSATNPSTSVMNPQGGEARLIWSKGSAAPFRIDQHTSGLSREGLEMAESRRRIIVRDRGSQAFISAEITQPVLLGSNRRITLDFSEVSDDAVLTSQYASILLESVPFSLEAGVQAIKVHRVVASRGLQLLASQPRVKCEIIDALTGSVIHEFGVIDVPVVSSSQSISDSVEFGVPSLPPSSFKLRVRLEGLSFADTNIQVSLVKAFQIQSTLSSTSGQIAEGHVTPDLRQNYPNPFNPSTEITFEVVEMSHVTLSVFDLLGREVTTLVNDRMSPGVHRVTFESSQLPAGVYFYRMNAGSHSVTRKMLFLK